MRVKDKSIIVTGSGGGIGEGIARRLAAEGAKVIVNDINVALGEKVAAAIVKAGWTHRNQPALDVSEDDFDKCYAINVKSIYLATIHATPVFRSQGGGSFINIASTAGVRPRPGLTWYNGSKGAVIVTSKSQIGRASCRGRVEIS